MASEAGLILYGPPAVGMDTITAALSVLDPRFVQFRRLKAGAGRTAGYHMVSLEEFTELEDAGQLLQVNSAYDALYGVDREGVIEHLTKGLVPVVHVGQVDGVHGLLSAGLPLRWTAVCLWCSRAECERRLTDRGDEHQLERLKVWDETVLDLQAADPALFQLSLNTVSLSPENMAEMVARTVGLEPLAHPAARVVIRRARQLFGQPRFIGYLQHCGGDEYAAFELYRWNNAVGAAVWEVLGYFEIAFRNALATRMSDRHRRQHGRGSWLDDPFGELDRNAREDIGKARGRVVRKSKSPSDGQTIAELGLGFWRYLLARRYSSNLWPDLAGAFPNAPDRARETVELPVIRLHEFRNRLAHHERIWTEPIRELHAEILTLLRFIDEELGRWVANQSRVPGFLAKSPQPLPRP